MFKGELIELGEFELTTPVMRVSDPGYDRDVWCCGTIHDCKVGTWEAAILKKDQGDWGVRVAVLAVRFKDGGPKFTTINRAMCNATGKWVNSGIDVGVDSGQAGFYDDTRYRDNSIFDGLTPAKSDFGDEWFNHCCDCTLSSMQAGVIPYGVVSTSGYGDGSYDCIYHTGKDGLIDFAFIIFTD